MPPGRPKLWRKKAFDVLNEAVTQRIEGSKLEERNDNNMWLVRDLELARQFILEDLRVVKSLCVPCFPSHYNILDEYVKMYHNALSDYVSISFDIELINEYFHYYNLCRSKSLWRMA